MYKRAYSFLHKYSLLYQYQFGFRHHHSTCLALIELCDKSIFTPWSIWSCCCHVLWPSKSLWYSWSKNFSWTRPASADRTARRQFQATGQLVSRTQASDAMTSRLPRYEAKCVQRRCFQCGSVTLHSDIKWQELPPANILIPLERQLTALQPCRWEFLYNETLQQTFHRVLPLPTYWYHSKGNWLRYISAADSFYIMKLCSRLFVLYCPKYDKFRYFIPILSKLGAV